MSKLRNNPFTRTMAEVIRSVENNNMYKGLPKGTTRGVIVDVNDPEERGRVRVLFDAMNSTDIPSIEGAGEYSLPREGEPVEYSHWIDVSPAFTGKQPESLIGKRVTICLSNSQYQYAVLQDVIYDPQNLTDDARSDFEMPNNSTMTRLPCYPSGTLPPATRENAGCTVIEMDGPMDSDWLCVCLKRQGAYYWVRHVDMAHGHSGQDDGVQPPDSRGDREQPVNQQTIWDFVFPTTGKEMNKSSKYGTGPRSNPFGGEAKWYSPPG